MDRAELIARAAPPCQECGASRAQRDPLGVSTSTAPGRWARPSWSAVSAIACWSSRCYELYLTFVSSWYWLAIATIAMYATFVAWLAMEGRRANAGMLVRLIPDCAVLIHRLLRDPRVPRRSKWLLIAGIADRRCRSTSSRTSFPSPGSSTTRSSSRSSSATSCAPPARNGSRITGQARARRLTS